jgi:hypothetical protein
VCVYIYTRTHILESKENILPEGLLDFIVLSNTSLLDAIFTNTVQRLTTIFHRYNYKILDLSHIDYITVNISETCRYIYVS